MQLRAGIYDRVSTAVKRAGVYDARSVDEQDQANRAACLDHAWLVATSYQDPDRSASRFATREREDWPRLMADLEAGQLDVLVLWEPSRGSRELEAWAALLNACRIRGVLIHITSHNRTYDVREARDWRTLAEEGVDSGYESEKGSVRVRRALAANAANGTPHGRTMYGYLRHYDPTTKKYIETVKHPEQASIVSEIIRRVAKGDPISEIVTDLNGRGVPAPEGPTWHRGPLRSICNRYAYIAKRDYQGQLYDCQWPTLVDETVFYAARRVLSDPARKTTRPGRAKYLLSYLAVCDICEGKLGVGKRHGYLVYRCVEHGCVAVRRDWLDDLITKLVLERLSMKDIYEKLAMANDDQVLEARATAAKLREKLEEHYIEAAKPDGLSAAGLTAVERQLLPQIEEADQRAVSLSIPQALRELLQPGVDIAERWKALGVASRKEVVRVLVDIRLRRSLPGKISALDVKRVVANWHHE